MTDLAEDARVLELMKPIRCWGGGGGTTFLDSRDVGEVIGALVAEVRELRAILSELVSSLKAVGFGHMPKEAYEAPNPSGAQLVEAALARAAEAP